MEYKITKTATQYIKAQVSTMPEQQLLRPKGYGYPKFRRTHHGHPVEEDTHIFLYNAMMIMSTSSYEAVALSFELGQP